MQMRKEMQILIMSVISVLLLCSCTSQNTKEMSGNTDITEEATMEEIAEELTTEEIITEEPTTEYVELSEQCDYILCDGYDGDDYYELVANEKDDYPNSTFEFGVIKNNDWLVKMSKKCPFIDKDGWWKGIDKEFSNEIDEESFAYLDEGCFMYKNSIIYKPETGVYFDVWNTEQSYYKDGEILYEKIVNEGKVVTQNNHGNLAIFDMNTGKSKEVGGDLRKQIDDSAKRPTELHGIGNGIFFAGAFSNFIGTSYCGFYNLDGKQIIDCTEYSINDYGDYMFENGEITLVCSNNSNVKFYLTFNKKGKVVRKEKVE